MTIIDRPIRRDIDKTTFIRECEQSFESQLNDVCSALTQDNDLRIVSLSGPTCSGKTTTANKLISELSQMGRDVHLISIDDFFKERSKLDKEAAIKAKPVLDYDSIDAIDFELLSNCADSILSHRSTILPKYDFILGKRKFSKPITSKDNSIFIFEGIQAIYPEVVALLGAEQRSIYVNVADDLEIEGTIFKKRDIRLMRRLIRDYKFRGAKPEFTFGLWRSVVSNEENSIVPFESSVDMKINSLMPYEILLYKGLLPPILSEVPETSRFLPRALELIDRLEKFDYISPSLVPKQSLLREFIG